MGREAAVRAVSLLSYCVLRVSAVPLPPNHVQALARSALLLHPQSICLWITPLTLLFRSRREGTARG